MRAVAGAIVVLAGAVVAGAGVVSEAILRASGRSWSDVTCSAIYVGAVLGLIGFGSFVVGLCVRPPTGGAPPAESESGVSSRAGAFHRRQEV